MATRPYRSSRGRVVTAAVTFASLRPRGLNPNFSRPRANLADVRSLRFLLSRRWVLFAITVALLAWATWLLGLN